jgi:putative phage-type endonuclease
MEQRSPEWFEARKNRVTGSMVGAILGLDPNTSRAEAMRRMVRAAHGAPSEFVGNIATNWGQMHEQEAKEAFEYQLSEVVAPASFVVHPMLEWLGASPDGYVGEDALLEVKCPFGLRDHAAPVPFKTISDQSHYHAQMQVQMFVTERKRCFFWQWTPHGYDMTVVDYEPDWIAENLPKLQAFYQEFLEEDPEDHLEERRVVIDTPRALQMMAEYDDLVDAAAKAEERRKELLEEIVKLAGGRNAVVGRKKLTKVEKAGSISYAQAVKVLAPGADLERWRGKPSSYWLFK